MTRKIVKRSTFFGTAPPTGAILWHTKTEKAVEIILVQLPSYDTKQSSIVPIVGNVFQSGGAGGAGRH